MNTKLENKTYAKTIKTQGNKDIEQLFILSKNIFFFFLNEGNTVHYALHVQEIFPINNFQLGATIMKTCLFREAKYAMLESPFIFEAYTVIAKSQSLPSCIINAFCGHHAVFSVQYPQTNSTFLTQAACCQTTKATEILH